ncbi:MAG: FAD-dependent oxidoreductase, partial [Halofilum sp. (in: g-proteobacteria)]
MARDIIVLGAGMVGVSVAYHLVLRGHRVCLVDRREPGRETSFGNAGIIQREAVEPYAFPQDYKTLLRFLANRSIDVRYRPPGVAASAGPLLSYWWHSFPTRYERIVPEYASLIALSTQAHTPMIEAAGAEDLVRKQGWLELYRTSGALARRAERARTVHARYGVEFEVLDREAVLALEPHLAPVVAGAIHWQNSWTVASPGDLVKAYAELFTAEGGTLHQGAISGLETGKSGWSVTTETGALEG